MAGMASLHLRYKILGLMIMSSHRTFLAKISIYPANSILARQIYYTSSMEISLSLLKIMNVRTTFGPYHKHWDVHICIIPATIAHPCQHTGVMENHLLHYLGAQPSLVSIIASYKQTTKSLPAQVCQQVWKPPNKQCMRQFKYANTVPTVSCTCNDLICDYMSLVFTSACGQKCDMLCHVKFTTIHGNCMNTMSFTILW